MLKNQKGLALVEVLILCAIALLVGLIIAGSIVNNRGATEKRGLANAQIFIGANDIKVKRITCAGDGDNDGYGTCNLVTMEGEKIMLNCPTNYVDVVWYGATSCKEVVKNMNFAVQP